MSNTKENKALRAVPVILALFFLLRGFLLSDRNHLGFEDLYTFKMNPTEKSIVFLVLLFVFSVLAGLVISGLNKRFGESATFLSVLLLTEPFVFAKQDNTLVLFIFSLALLFILNAIREKPIIPNEITLIVFLLVSTVLVKNAIFLFVLPALILYFAGDGENLLKSTKKLVMMILSVVSVGAGIYLNDYLVSNYPAFDNLIKTYSFFRQVYFRDIDYENVFLFFFALPVLAFGVYFLVEFVKNCDSSKRNTASYVAVCGVALGYILAITGFILRGSEAFYTINLIFPSAIFALIANKNKEAEKALEKVNSFVSKHTFVLVTVTVLMSFLVTVIFYKETDNIAGFILSI